MRKCASEPKMRRISPLVKGLVGMRHGHHGIHRGRPHHRGHLQGWEARRSCLEMLANPDVKWVAQRIYNKHNRNRGNNMTVQELHGLLQSLHAELGMPTPPSEEMAEKLFKRFDVNNDKVLTFKEFFELFVASLRRSAFDRSTLVGREFFVTKQDGSIWGIYDRVRQLGVGSFGTAYLCKHKLTKEDRVVKAVKKSRAKIPVEDIEKEIMVMRQVDHPHIVRLFEWFEDSNRIYLVLEALKGGTLKDVILGFAQQRKCLNESWTRSVVRQTAGAMSYCHGLRLIHKDLKDENIMLLMKDPNFKHPFAVIIDLGVAEMFSLADPQGQEAGGTPVTMAPEVWMGSFGPKCDVWSLGCVLFEMLVGDMPFNARSMSASAWLRLHKRGPDWNLVRTSALGKNLCKSMLIYKDDERPSMTECLQHEWFTVEPRSLCSVQPEQLEALRSFCDELAIRRTLLLEIASRLPMNRAERIVEMFETFDKDRGGTLTIDELKDTFTEVGLDDEDLVLKIFDRLDVDSNGALSFSEFAAGVLLIFQDILEDRLQALFSEYDVDKDGALDTDEAEVFLADAALMLKKDCKSRSQGMLHEILHGSGPKIPFEVLRDKLFPSLANRAKSEAKGI